jgi:hypothetical protein
MCCVLLPVFAGGGSQSAAQPTGPFPGKIALVTSDVSQNEEEYRSAEQLVAKYGANKVTHVTWPANFMAEQEQMVTIVSRIAADRDVRALVINQSVPGTNAAVDKLLETRNDIYIVYCSPQENPVDVARRANLILNNDQPGTGPAMVHQAQAQGAKVMVHYSFPRHMAQVLLSGRRDLIRQTCEEVGMQFVDATAPDPTGDAGLSGTQQFILEDVPRMVARYGKDTAFFATNCGMQIPLIKSVVEQGAIYPQPCCPSPFHGFPSALGIPTSMDINFTVTETRRIAAANNMLGRLSTWPAPAAMAYTNAGAEYAIRVLNGTAPRDRIDERILAECLSNYIRELTGTTVEMFISNWVEAGRPIENYKLVRQGYLTF